MKIFIPFLALLLLIGCRQAPAPAEQPQRIFSVRNDDAPSSDELTDSLILQKIYGTASRNAKEYGIDHPGEIAGKIVADSTQFSKQNWESLGVQNGFVLEYVVENKWEIEVNGLKKWLIVLGSRGNSCHPCPGVCAGAVFAKNGAEWKLETYENDIAVLGASGVPVNVVEYASCGDNAFAIVLETGSIWQGTACDFFTVVVYKDGKFSEALENPVDYAQNNWNNCTEVNSFIPCYGYTATVYFKPEGKNIWNMLVHFQGTQHRENTSGPVPLNRKVRFEYLNGRYETKDKLPSE